MPVLAGVLRGLPRGPMRMPGMPGFTGRGGPSWEARARFMQSMGRSPQEAELAARAGVMLGERAESPETQKLRAAREWDRRQKVIEEAREARAQATAKATAEAKAAEASHREKALNMMMGGPKPPLIQERLPLEYRDELRPQGMAPDIQQRPLAPTSWRDPSLATLPEDPEAIGALLKGPPSAVQTARPQGPMGFDDDLKRDVRSYVETGVGLSPMQAMTEQRRRNTEAAAAAEARAATAQKQADAERQRAEDAKMQATADEDAAQEAMAKELQEAEARDARAELGEALGATPLLAQQYADVRRVAPKVRPEAPPEAPKPTMVETALQRQGAKNVVAWEQGELELEPSEERFTPEDFKLYKDATEQELKIDITEQLATGTRAGIEKARQFNDILMKRGQFGPPARGLLWGMFD